MSEHERTDERELEEEIAEAASTAFVSPADAVALARSEDGEPSPQMAAFLSAQTRLLSLQSEHMHEQRVLQLEHLHVRRWRERLQISLQLLLWTVAILIISGIAALAIWAMHDESLVIQPLKTPAAMTGAGLDGTVIAAKVLDGVKSLQRQASSARAPSTMKGAAEDDIKVEIPETGVSVGELLKYLRAWLGHETQVTGEVYLDGQDLVVTVRTGEEPGKSFRGPRQDLDALIAQASETVFAQAQPYLYAVYLNEHGRQAESLKVAQELALTGPPRERGWAYAHWANLLLHRGDNAGAAVRARQALAFNAALVTAQNNLGVAEWNLSHDEAAYRARRRALELIRPGRPANVTAAAADQFRVSFEELADEASGDYGAAARLSRRQMELPDYSDNVAEASISIADNLADDHDAAGSRAALAKTGLQDDTAVLSYLAADRVYVLPYADLAVALDDWSGAVADLQSADAWMAANEADASDYRQRRLEPRLALALAHTGQFAAAEQLVGTTPLDCLACLIARGQVAALQGQAGVADGWFHAAVKAAPSLPKPYLAWGVALLARGDAQGAAQRGKEAVRRGPHFADAYVLQAEAALRQGQVGAARLQLTKANRYAPAWGHLHLLWGEALKRDGMDGPATAEFRRAQALGLSSADRARLAQALRGR